MYFHILIIINAPQYDSTVIHAYTLILIICWMNSEELLLKHLEISEITEFFILLCPSYILNVTMFREVNLLPSSGERMGSMYTVASVRKS
jgi:hypothetical protein